MTALNKVATSLNTQANLSLTLTVIWAIERYYVNETKSSLLISQYAETNKSAFEHIDIIENVLKRTSQTTNIKYLIQSDDYNIYFNEEVYFKHTAIWFIDSLEAFRRLREDLLDENLNYKRNGYFCIVYTGKQKFIYNKMRLIFRRLFKINVIYVNIILQNGRTTHVYTSYPFTKTQCHNPEPQLHGVLGPLTDYKFSKAEFFQKKLRNMWGCPIYVTTWLYPPFITEEHGRIKGIEGLLLEEMAARRNFSLQYNTIGDPRLGLEQLQTGETNISIGAMLYNKERLEIASAVQTYYYVQIVMAIPNGQMMTPWQRLLRPFKYIIWSCFGSSIIMGIAIIICLKKFFKPYVHKFVFGEGVRFPLINFWNVLYGGSLPGPLPQRNFARYILAVWILYTWVLRSAYVGELFNLLQDSKARSQFSTLTEVIQQNFSFYILPLMESLLVDASAPLANLHRLNVSIPSLERLFKNLQKDDAKYAVTALAPLISVYNMKLENRMQQVNVLRETLLSAPVTFYVRKHSYLVYEFDDVLLKIMSAGLIKKYADFYASSNPVKARYVESKEHTQLTLWLLLGIFSVYLVLILLCLLVFLLELWSKRSPFIKRVIDFFDY